MSGDGDYELVLTAPARRAVTGKLPEAVAVAVMEFPTTALIRQPTRAGKPLRDDLAGIWSTHRGTYRVLYTREIIVLRTEHRRDSYRPL